MMDVGQDLVEAGGRSVVEDGNNGRVHFCRSRQILRTKIGGLGGIGVSIR